MAGRARAEARAHLGAELDLTWQKYVRCTICNRRICVNNYPDRKPRMSKRWHVTNGIVLCGWCRFGDSGSGQGDQGEFVSTLYIFVMAEAALSCKRPISVNEEGDLVTADCGLCRPCRARAVMSLSPKVRAQRVKEQRDAKKARAVRQASLRASDPGDDEEGGA